MEPSATERKKNKHYHSNRRPKANYTPEELAPIIPPKSPYDRFTSIFVMDGKEFEIRIQPEKGKDEPHGLPTLYAISLDHHHFGWLTNKAGQWKWFSNEQPQHLADLISEIIIAHYE